MMPESVKKQNTRRSLAAKQGQAQGGLASFLHSAFDLRTDWLDRRNIAKNNFEMGIQQFRLGNTSDAIFRFKVATLANGKHAASWYWLGRSLLKGGRMGEAARALRKAALLKPGDDHINYMLAVVLGGGAPSKITPTRVPLDLIRDHFDQVATQYNQAVTMEERTEHMQVAAAARQAAQQGRIDHMVLDLGVGTGLCGSQLRDIAFEITGVDLSSSMLQQAEARQGENGKKLYDKLIHREALEFLQASEEKQYDIVLASGLMHYLGDLTPLFAQVARVLKPGGMLVFAAGHSAGDAVRFNPEQEMFCFSQNYLEKMAKDNGFVVTQLKETVLMPGQPGWIGVYTRA